MRGWSDHNLALTVPCSDQGTPLSFHKLSGTLNPTARLPTYPINRTGSSSLTNGEVIWKFWSKIIQKDFSPEINHEHSVNINLGSLCIGGQNKWSEYYLKWPLTHLVPGSGLLQFKDPGGDIKSGAPDSTAQQNMKEIFISGDPFGASHPPTPNNC